MKKVVLYIALIFCVLGVQAQYVKEYRKDGSITKDYGFEKGMFNGVYVSYHANGEKKAEGYFEDNQRMGEWSVWDTTGQLRMKRLYENHYSFSILEMYNEKGESIQDSIYWFSKQKTENGYEYLNTDSTVLWAKNMWREVPLASENMMLLIAIRTAIKNGSKKYITSELKEESDAVYSKDLKIEGYKIKEEIIYDKSKRYMETQIVSIAPYTEKGDLFWVDYNALREELRNIRVNSDLLYIETVDDYLFYRQYNSELYKELNVYDRKISDYKEGDEIQDEINKIEANIIEIEHDIWLHEAGYRRNHIKKQ